MRSVSRSLLVLALAAIMASPLVAGDKKKKGKRKGRKGHHAAVIHLPRTIKLTAEQKGKVAALRKEFGPKLAAMQKKFAAILTPEQKKARRAAMQKAKEAGTKGRELRKTLNAAVELTKDQKQQMKEVRKQMHSLRDQIRTALKKILTPDQQAQLKTRHGQGRRKGKKKRPAAN